MNHFTIFTETLEDYIIKENTTVYQFAKNVGLSGQAITNWLNRIGYPDTESANKIANYLCVSLDFLFGLSDSPKPNNDANDLPFLEKFDLLRKKEPRQLLRRRQRMQFRRIRNFKMEKRQTAKTGKRHSNRQIFRLFPRLSDRQKVLNLKSPRRRRVGGFLFDFILRYPRSRCRTAGICRKILAAGFRRTGISPYMSAKKCRSDFG